jgi:hypothetical protein
MTADPNLHYDFTHLITASPRALIYELVDTHSNLANLATRIAFLRAEETRQPKSPDIKAQRIEFEGVEKAYVEKKFLLLHLLRDDRWAEDPKAV